MKFNVKNILKASCLFAAVMTVGACGEEATFENITPVTEGARVKFLHAVQGAPAVVVSANGKKWSAKLQAVANGPDSLVYGDVYPPVDYSVLPAGEVAFNVKSVASATTSVAVDAKATFENGKYYTVVAADTLPLPRVVVLTDDRSAIKNNNKTYVRFVNLLTGGAAAGYDFILRRAGVSTTLSSIKYGEAGGVLEIDPIVSSSTINDSLFVNIAGTTTRLTSINLNGSTTTQLTRNRLRTFILRGRLSSFGVSTIINN